MFLIERRPWFADMANFKAVGVIPKDLNWQQRKRFFFDARHYVWDDPYLFKMEADNLLRRCVTSEEANEALSVIFPLLFFLCTFVQSLDEITDKSLRGKDGSSRCDDFVFCFHEIKIMKMYDILTSCLLVFLNLLKTIFAISF